MRSLPSIRPARVREGSVSTDRQRRHRASVPLLPPLRGCSRDRHSFPGSCQAYRPIPKPKSSCGSAVFLQQSALPFSAQRQNASSLWVSRNLKLGAGEAYRVSGKRFSSGRGAALPIHTVIATRADVELLQQSPSPKPALPYRDLARKFRERLLAIWPRSQPAVPR